MLSKRSKSIWAATTTTVIMGIIIGCGGGSGTGGSTSVPTGNAAVVATSVGSYQSLSAGIAYPFSAIMASSPSGSTLHSLGMLSPLYRNYLVRLKPQQPLTLNPELNLYSDNGTTTATGLTFHYYTDSAGKDPAGTMSVNSPTGNFNYTSYPATVAVAVNLTAGNLPCQGSASITFGGDSGSNALKGTLKLTRNSEVLTVNLNLSDSMQVSGTLSISESGSTIEATNLNGPVTGNIALNVALQPQGFTGTGTINLTNDAITLDFTSPKGASCKLDSSGDLIVTYPSGTTDTIKNPLSATLSGALGVTGSTTGTNTTGTNTTGTNTTGTNTTGTNTTGTNTTGTTTGSYSGQGDGTLEYANAPVTISGTPSNGSSPATISSGNKNKQLVGNVQFYGVYWSSPTAQPKTLAIDPNNQTVTRAWSINSSSQIVGEVDGNASDVVPLYWPTPTATPVELKVLPGTVSCAAQWINDSGEIVGWSSSGQNNTSGYPATVPVYWKSYTASPVQLAGATNTMPSYISNSGAILGQIESLDGGIGDGGAGGYFPVVWKSPTATATSLGPNEETEPFGMSQSGIVTGTLNGAAETWSPNSYAAKALPAPAAYAGSGLTLNSAGAVLGYYLSKSQTLHLAVWEPNKNPFFVDELVPASTNADWILTTYYYGFFDLIDDVKFIPTILFDDYSMVVAAQNKAGTVFSNVYLAPSKAP